jgi:hypothetical protein
LTGCLAGYDFELMIACFGLWEDNHHTRVPAIDVEGAVTEIRGQQKGYRLAARTADVLVEGVRVPLAWDEPIEPMPGVARPWFVCLRCQQRCRHLYLDQVEFSRAAGGVGLCTLDPDFGSSKREANPAYRQDLR